MTDQAIDCRIRLAHSDFIMANHRVHGVSVLPGVTFLDLVYRILIAQGFDHQGSALREVLFTEAVTTREGYERELRVTIGAPAADGRPVLVASRWLRDGAEAAPWRENARARLVETADPVAAPADLNGWRAAAVRHTDVADLYRKTRGEGIVHGAPMTCHGTQYHGPYGLLAELRLDPSAVATAAAFHLHPAIMDASTLAAFGREEGAGTEPFIPFFIAEFRAFGPLEPVVYAHIPHQEVLAGTGDLLRNDYTLHGERGQVLARFTGISCKRIREASLITRLTEEVATGTPAPAVAPEKTAAVWERTER